MNSGPVALETTTSSESSAAECEMKVVEVITTTSDGGCDHERKQAAIIKSVTMNMVESNSIISSSGSDEFEPLLLYNAFMNSVLKTSQQQIDYDDVSLRHYLIAYEEITKFLYNLGNIFYFVIADLRKKIGIIDSYLKSQPNEYETFQSMVKYEWTCGKLKQPLSLNKQNAARVVLRLHRALIFIIRLLERVFNAESHLRTPQLCTEAYELTLAKYHRFRIFSDRKI